MRSSAFRRSLGARISWGLVTGEGEQKMNVKFGFTHFKSVAALAVVLVGLAAPSHAAITTLVPFDSVKNAASGTKIKFVIHYEFSKGGHSQVNTRNHLTRMANKHGFRLDRWTAQADVTPANLANVDVAVFNQGDGDVLEPANSSYVNAVKNFVEVQGKSLLQVHAAAAYIPCPTSGQENLTDANCRWLARVLVRQYFHHDNDNTKARIFADSTCKGQIPVGATGTAAVPATINHGRCNDSTKAIFDGLPPNGGTGATAGLKYTWDGLGDEWYNYRGYVRQQGAQVFDGVNFGPVITLVAIDESGYTSSYKMSDRVETWVRLVGNGVTAYNNMGHSDVWTRARSGNALGGTVSDSIAEKINWRLMKFLGHDFVGCTDSTYLEYNPQATVSVLTPLDDPAPCKNKGTAIRGIGRGASHNGISIARNGVVKVSVGESGVWRLNVVNTVGRVVYSRKVAGASGKEFELPRLAGNGVYVLRVKSPSGVSSAARLLH